MSNDGQFATRRCQARLTVPLPATQAFELFTPEGERAWAHGWDPTYVSDGSDRSAAGTVFRTQHGASTTTWIVAAREEGRRMLYARVGEWAGTVEVVLHPEGEERATVDIAYVLTAVDAASDARLSHFAQGFPGFIASWSTAIEDHLAQGGHTVAQ